MINDEMKQKLIETADKARENCYVPYSHYPVGAALLTESGKIFSGCNIENSAFPVTICAERCAMFKAISEGSRDFAAIAIVTENGGSPCGSCRQVMCEFAPNMPVICADKDHTVTIEKAAIELLPGAFTPESLKSA